MCKTGTLKNLLVKPITRTTILAIETSCDETSLAILECSGGLNAPRFKVIKNLITSQIPIHRPFGGVVPNLAKREHLKNLPMLWKQITQRYSLTTINHIAVTVGPGLEPALWTGIEFAKEKSKTLGIPLIGANHMEGHLYSNWLPKKKKTPRIQFPAIGLVVSGGHTILLHMTATEKWEVLGETLDDAAGEAFDKVARLLKLPYPGGPEIQKLAEQGNPRAIPFPRPTLQQKNYNFSFSGLKTAVLYYLRDHQLLNTNHYPLKTKADIAASFQEAIVDVLSKKTERAAQEYEVKTILLCGGVSANKSLRERLAQTVKKMKIKFFVPDLEFNTDNAAMIGAAAYMQLLQKKNLPIEAGGALSL